MVHSAQKAPILLLNEADAIFCKRCTRHDTATDKMENAMQNIIQQELEQLEGILIATTNLTENMDNALERRFLYKVRFDRPSVAAKTAIWQAMLPTTALDEASVIAHEYDLSGGQIENIVRKLTVDYVISGEAYTLARLRSLCESEVANSLKGSGRSQIGFKL